MTALWCASCIHSRMHACCACRDELDEPDAQHARCAFVRHPAFPYLPATVPLTFTLTMKACLSENPDERPTFGQILTIFDDVVFEVASGSYLNSLGQMMVRFTRPPAAAAVSSPHAYRGP